MPPDERPSLAVVDGKAWAAIRGGLRTFKTEVELHGSAPFSFYADDNAMRWELKAHVDVPQWPDWSHTEPLTVRP